MCVCVCVCVCGSMCVCVDLCVLLEASSNISGIFEVAPECLEDQLLSILAQRSHKLLCRRKPARREKRTKDLVTQEWDPEVES